MLKRYTLSFFFLGLALFVNAQTDVITSPKSTEEKLAQFLKLAEELRIKTNVPGVGLAVVHQHKLVHVGGLGLRDQAEKLPVTENTLFAIGSTTKAFTGVLAAKLVAKGQLNWKDKIIQHIPDFKLQEEYVARNVTLEDAFKHMTGLGRHDDIWVKKGVSRADVLNQLPNLSLDGSLRERWDYNNLMYLVAGVVTEKVSKKSWEESIQQEIFAPLGMPNSYTNYTDFLIHKERAKGYAADGVTMVPPLNADAVAPAGSISSTPVDVAKWLEMWVNQGQFQGTTFLQKEEFDYMTSPNENMSYMPPSSVRYYSVGWSGTMTEGKRHIGHAGAGDGQNALIFIRPADGFGIFIMTNQVSDYKYLLQTYAENIFLDDNFKRDLPREDEIAIIAKFNRFDVILKDKGEDTALEFFKTFKGVNLEGSINQLGYIYLREKDYKKAIFLMQLNTQEYPNSANAYDSLGEAYFHNKDYDLAIKNYEKSLALNEENGNARTMIERIKKEKS